MYVCMYVYIYIYIIYVYLCLYVYVCTRVHVCIYIYIHTYTDTAYLCICTYIKMHTQTHAYTCRPRTRCGRELQLSQQNIKHTSLQISYAGKVTKRTHVATVKFSQSHVPTSLVQPMFHGYSHVSLIM